VPFEIEFVSTRLSFLLARQLDAGDFAWPPGTTLEGRLVRAMSMPRALGPEGQPRTDLWAIEVDVAGFTVGQIVRLSTP
jgi:hypothetical protein